MRYFMGTRVQSLIYFHDNPASILTILSVAVGSNDASRAVMDIPREAPKPYLRESNFAHVFEGGAENENPPKSVGRQATGV